MLNAGHACAGCAGAEREIAVKRIAFAVSAAIVCALYAGCGSSREAFGVDDAGAGAGADATTSGFNGDAALAAPPDCSPVSTNLAGCSCKQKGQAQACYSGAAGSRHVGACKDGTQTCAGTGEFATWGPCTGDVVPATENCSGTVDANCNGKVGCADPACASLAPGFIKPDSQGFDRLRGSVREQVKANRSS